MTVGFMKETDTAELRVAMVPAQIASLTKAGCRVVMERGAGAGAGYTDSLYRDRDVEILDSARQVIETADVILTVRAAAAAAGNREEMMRTGQVLIGFLEPYGPHDSFRRLKDGGVTSFAMELMPRITRAQSMDALSSMANLSGYKAVLLAAGEIGRMIPMMMTAAGTVVPARVFIIGAGVAGLQAIATARRLGGVVSAYDVRPEVREQVESLGAKFVEISLDTADVQGGGGYAREMDESFYQRQQELMAGILAESEIVITTAAVPGRPAPVLITRAMVEKMAPGSVIVDLAAERGGNCELSRAGRTEHHNGVALVAPVNLPSTLAHTASQLYARNIATFLLSLFEDGELHIDTSDEIVSATLITHNGEVWNPGLRDAI